MNFTHYSTLSLFSWVESTFSLYRKVDQVVIFLFHVIPSPDLFFDFSDSQPLICSSHPSTMKNMKNMSMDGHTPHLPEEIIGNILKRLPVKTLIRFQCVCKQWRNLIKTPLFIADHLQHSTRQNPNLLIEQIQANPLRLFLVDCHLQSYAIEKPPLVSALACVRVIGCCNGLLCLADYRMYPPSPLLWNPAIRQVRQLPETTDPFDGECILGFGFSHAINDYKVVRIYEVVVVRRVEVYSVSTGTWKDIEFGNLEGVTLLSNAVSTNGLMFWYGVRLGEEQMDLENTYVIVSFDIATEVFTIIACPASVSYSGRLTVYKNKLATLSHSRIGDSQYSCLHFGVMEEEVAAVGSSRERWSSSKKYIRSSCPFKLHLGTVWMDQIVCIVFGLSGGGGEVSSETEGVSSETEGVGSETEVANDETKVGLYFFDVNTNECKRINIPGPHYYIDVYNYAESLVPLVG